MNENNSTEVRVAGIDLRLLLGDMLRLVRRTVLLFAALAVLCAAVLCWRARSSYYPMYRASATFTVYVTNPLQSEIRSYNTATAEQMAKTFPYILTSGALSERVMSTLGISAMPSVTASVLSGTNIFTLTVTSADAQLAYDVLGAVIECYPDVAEFVVGPTVMNLLDESGLPTQPFNTLSYTSAVKRGVLLAALVWLAAVFVLASLRSTVHSEEELRRVLSLRTLGVLPVVRGMKKSGARPRFDNASSGTGFSEAVRLLRMRTEKELDERGMKVLLVSSAIPGEGKTTVAINLAAALAAHGKRVLLADCDLRNPSVAPAFGLENSTGLVEFLRGKAPYQDILRQSGIEGLYLVLAGAPASEDASELLSRPECRQFMDACRKAFDYVILDTPPAALLVDASELAVLADGAVMTVRQNYAPRARIMEGAQVLSDSRLPLIGCVLNYASGGAGYGGYYGRAYGSYGSQA